MALLNDDYLINPLCVGVLPGTFVLCGEGMGYCSDECMVIGSFKCGAAALGGILLMAMAIADNPAVEACPRCFKYAYESTHFGRHEWLCNDCYKIACDAAQAALAKRSGE